MTRVLIAVEDSDASVATARTAYELFGSSASYIVINVAESGPVLWGDNALAYGMVYPLALPGTSAIAGVRLEAPASAGALSTDDAASVAEQKAADVALKAGLAGAEPVGDKGDPAAAIIAAAKEHKADVIVIGSHDRGWFKRLFTGSVSHDVERHAEVPVLITR